MEVERFFGVEIATTETPLKRALSGDGKIVVFDGHSNFGIGPNFKIEHNKHLPDFTDFGAGSTDIPIDFIGDGTQDTSFINDQLVDDVLEWLDNQQGPYPTAHLTQAQDKIFGNFVKEGFCYAIPAANEVPNQRNNYTVPQLGFLRYQNNEGVGHGQPFVIQGAGVNRWHMTNWVSGENEKSLIVLVDGDKVPNPLKYGTYFYNACSTGRDYIEVFEEVYGGGDFIYSYAACAVGTATHVFVKMTVEGSTNQQIVNFMNAEDLGETPGIAIDYGVK